MDVSSRCVGSLLGMAVCDAVGTTVEFMPPGSFSPVDDMVGGGKFSLLAGQWTDDTSMGLCLAESLVECQGFNPIDQCKRYYRWYQDGHLSCTGECFDIGKTTRMALNKFQRSSETDPFPGSTSERAAGNGCLMRLAPVPLCYHTHPEAGMKLSGVSACVTHGPPNAVHSCRYYAGLIIGCLQGASKEELLSKRYSPIPNYWDTHPLVPEVDEIACGSFKVKQPPDIRASGYVISSMEAALWAFYHTSSFKEGCLKVVNLGDDADTAGAIYGQLAGAYYGAGGIPDDWKQECFFTPLIEVFASELLELSKKIVVSPELVDDATDLNTFDWNANASAMPVSRDHLSHQYQIVKLQGYEQLETGNREIVRKLNPGPRQYKRLEALDKDTESLVASYKALPQEAQEEKLLSDFQRNWTKGREKIDLIINRFSHH